MRPVPIVLALAFMTLTGCAFLLWSALHNQPPNEMVLGTTLAFATVLLVLPWSLGIFRPPGVGHPCDACGRALSTEMKTGFCLYCGEFISRSVAKWYARRV